MAKTYKSIIKKRNLKEIFYQIEFFGKKLWMNAIKPFVLAAGTSAGKTITSLIQLEIFYSIPENSKKITLILSSSTTVLRDNFSIALEEFNPSFSYYVVSNKKELQEAIKDGYQVIVCLPQTLNNNYKLLPKITNFILDEAHQWYFKPTIKKIIKHCKPTHQLLLTGTPSRFNAKGNDFEFYYVPVMDLYENDLVSNIKIEVVSSSYDFKQSDYLSSYGNLKADKTNSPIKAKESFKMVCDEMILKLRARLGNKYLANLRGANKVSALFNDLKKTIIFCHSLKQANAFYKELSSMKGLKDKVLLSHSENDKNSENFEMFRTDSRYKVLVAVDRGKLGYNLPDLFNVVDFSMTQSLDMILQMMGRILRLSDSDNEKIYFKVATKNTSGYFVDLMTAVVCLLTNNAPNYYYSSFNGKNMGGILIPKVKTTRPKANGKSTSTNKKKQNQRIATLEELGIPLDLNLFNQSILYSQGDKFSTVAWTTLDVVRREFFELNEKISNRNFLPFNEAREFVHSLGLKNMNEWHAYCSSKDRHPNIPSNPKRQYENEWIDLPDWLGNGIISTLKISDMHLSYHEAKKYIKKFKFKNYPEYKKYIIDNNIDFLPIAPKTKASWLKNGEWKGYSDFLGTDIIANQNKKFWSYNRAKKFVHSLNLKSREDWINYKKTKNKPAELASDKSPYGKDWISWGDFLGNGKPKGWQKLPGFKKGE